MKTSVFIIGGMSCAACSASVNRVVSRLEGVEACEVNLITGKMNVTYDENLVTISDFTRVVEKAGFTIEEEKEEKKEVPKEKGASVLPLIFSAIPSALLLYISMGQMIFENIPLPDFLNINTNPLNFALAQLILCLPALFFGRSFFIKGIPLLIKGHPNMDSLVALGSLASFIFSIVMTFRISADHHAVHNLYFESVAVVITLVMLGKYFEAKSKNKTKSAIEKLMALTPDTAILLKDGKEFTVKTEDLRVGDIVLVKPGNKFPLDAKIISGNGFADESMLTGESLPVEKHEGDDVTGGSICLNSALQIKVTKTGKDTTLAKIIKFVEDAQNKKAPISKTADKVAGVFVPIVIAIALVSALIWFIVKKDIAFSLQIFTSVLVVACPCALGLATPTAIMVGTGLGAKNGILIRDGEALETTHKIKAAVFDKTGTLTTGNPVVTDIISENENELLELASCAEANSDHPLAKAVVGYAKEKGIESTLLCEDFEYLSGFGLKCKIDSRSIIIGKPDFLKANEINIKKYDKDISTLASMGKSIILLSCDNIALGLIAIADELKPDAKNAISKLKLMGIKTIMLSGDNELCVKYMSNQLGLDEAYFEVLPEEKAEIVKKLKSKYGSVLMVGDGINDSIALASADVGCAIGTGSDIAIESADIVLMKDDISDVYKAINLSRLTITNIKQNLFWAFCYNSLLIPVAAGVLYIFSGPLLNPMLAGLAMSLSSVFVVSNALRLNMKNIEKTKRRK